MFDFQDFEEDHTNPVDLAKRVNPRVLPAFLVQMLLTVVLLVTGCWLGVALSLPLAVYHGALLYLGRARVDAGALHMTKWTSREVVAKFVYYLVMTVVFLVKFNYEIFGRSMPRRPKGV